MAFREFTGELDSAPPPPKRFVPFTGELDAAPAPPEALTEEEARASSIPSRFIAGVTSPARVLMKIFGSDRIKKQIADVDALRQRGMEKQGTGFDFAGLAGSMLPGGLIAKGVGAALPATSALGRIGQGVVTGAATAAAQPLTNNPDELSSDKLKQIGFGGLAGGALPAGAETLKAVGRGARALIDPLTESGRDRILKQYLGKLIPEESKAALQTATAAPKVFVPGSAPTVGELASVDPRLTALAKHQDIISKLPEVSGQFSQRTAEQAGARGAAIGTIAKTPQEMAAQEALRKANAAVNYGEAFKQGVPVNNELKSLLARPGMKEALKRAKAMAINEGESFSVNGATSVKNMHYVKMALDDTIKDPERFGVGAVEAEGLRSLRDQLVAKLGETYQAARKTYASDSNVLNRMQVGQQLQDALQSPLGTAERSGVFANAVRNAPQTIKKATDGRVVTDDLAKILTQQEIQTVGNVGADLARADAFRRLAARTNLGTSDAIKGSVEPRLPNMLSRPAAVINKLLGEIGQHAEEKLASRAGGLYLSPTEFAKFIGPEVPSRYRPILEELMRQSAGAAGTMVGRQ